MKLVKIIVAGIVGGILIFMWGFVAHTILPSGHWGVKAIPAAADAPLQAALAEVPTYGMYVFPHIDEADMHSMDQVKMAAYDEKRKTSVAGFVVIAPKGEGMMNMNQMGREFGTDIIAAILGALVIFWGVTNSGPFRTVGMSIAMGLMAWFLISTSYNIWWRLPRDYILGELIAEVAGFAIAGVGFYIVGLLFRKRKAPEVDAI